MKRSIAISLTAVLALGLVIVASPPQPAVAQSTIYVDDDAPNDPGPGDPTVSDPDEDGSAAHPFDEIQEGIDDAWSGDTVQVASGTYNENIILKDGVQVLGASANVTTIDGSTARAGLPAYHVVVGAGNATLDGFTITGGNANGDGEERNGGGMYNSSTSQTVTNCTFSNNSAEQGGGMFNQECSPTITNCRFSSNSANHYSGGGMFNNLSSPTVTNCTFCSNSSEGWGGGMCNSARSDCISSPTVTNCTFCNNSSVWGGGMYNNLSSPTVTNCTFYSNTASPEGGGIYNYHSGPTVTNCIFYNNSAAASGGAIYNHFSSYKVTNCTFSGNSAPFGRGLDNYGSTPTVTNCILWGNGQQIRDWFLPSTVTYCDVQGGYPGVGNKDADPMFIDPAGGDYHLQSGSPCIDAGTNDAPNLPATDFEGDPRILPVGGVVDMGADEYVPPPVIEAAVDFDPDTLHLACNGKVVTIYIELPMGYDVGQIDVSTIVLNGEVPALEKPINVGDHDSDGVPDLMVKFNRSDVQDVLEPGGDEVEVTVSGELTDGTLFEGTDTIRTIK